MKKYTRKHYNKKLIAFGLSLFMGIGITSTGFAAWVMSRDAQEEASDGVNVAIIEDASVEITLWQLDENGNIVKDEETGASVALVKEQGKPYALNDNFSFDAKADDNEGRLRASAGSVEDLKVTIKGTLDTHGVDYDLTATLTLPDTIKAAITAGYLKLKETVDGGDYLTGANVTVDETTGDFTVVLEFEWGDFFKNENPSVYYDTSYPESTAENPLGKAISDEEMEKQMTEFRKAITGYDDDAGTLDNETLKKTYTGSFTLKLSATPSVVGEDPEQGTV